VTNPRPQHHEQLLPQLRRSAKPGQLRRLSLSGSKGISDLTPLMELRYLRHLYLQGAAGNLDLSPLGHLRNLTVRSHNTHRVGSGGMESMTRIEA
jgi:hypothetical protein